ncbi:MAG: hypothetical protein ACRDWH_08255, partial [Acidimicrobiia bacterium]
MVAELARLKLLLTWNGLRKDWQRRIGLPAVLAAMTWVAWTLAARFAREFSGLAAEQAGEFSMWAAAAFFVGWVALPVVIFPLDETLDPAQLAVFPIPRARLLTGLAVAFLIGPSVVVPLTMIVTNIAVHSGLAQIVAIVAGVILLGQIAVASHLFTGAISAMLRSRRGRDLAVLVVVAIGLLTFGGYQVVGGVVEKLGLAGAVARYPIADWAVLLPPVAAQRAVVEAQAGHWWVALAMLAAAAVWLLVMSKAWGRMLGWMLVTPDHSPRPDKARHRRGLAERGAWGTRSVIARKELRFYMRDPRQRLVWTGTVIFVGLAVAVLVVGTESMAQFRQSSWLPLLAPAMVLFVGLPIALNQFGWERNAASYLFALPIKPRHLLHGKNIAIVLGLGLETAFLAVLLAAFSGSWGVLQLVPALAVAAIGCQLAVGNLVSVISPLRLPREGTDVFSQATEQGCLALVAQMASFLLIGLLMVPPSVAVVLTVSFGQVLSPTTTTIVSVVWGVVLYLI